MTEFTAEGTVFELRDDSGPVCFGDWAKLDADPVLARAIDGMVKLIESELGLLESNARLVVSDSVISTLGPSELWDLGLPPPSPLTVTVEARGSLTESACRLSIGYLHSDGRRAIGVSRAGAFLTLGDNRYTLSNAEFKFLSGIDRFNSNPHAGIEERMCQWAEIAALDPERVELDKYLEGMHVAYCDALDFDVHATGDASLEIHPIAMRQTSPVINLAAEALVQADMPSHAVTAIPSLPQVHQSSFSDQFRRFPSVHTKYALGRGWYLLVSERVKRILPIIRLIQDSDSDTIKRFARNPHSVIREFCGDEVCTEELDTILAVSDQYSERVSDIGEWKPKAVPFYRALREHWLPDEEFPVGIKIGDKIVTVESGDRQSLINEISTALTNGQEFISYKGQAIPATRTAIALLGPPLGNQAPEGSSDGRPKVGQSRSDVLLMEEKDNLESAGYVARKSGQRNLPANLPDGILLTLKPHQKAGLQWLQEHWNTGSVGALLADDMGLGKTLQCLTFVTWLCAEQSKIGVKTRPCLIVGPPGLLLNWLDESKKHLSEPVQGEWLLAYGAKLAELRSRQNRATEGSVGVPVLDLDRFRRSQYVLSTYETLRDYPHSFGKVYWSVVILDEAQKIKNPKALVTEECKAVSDNSDFVIAVTGTPVETRLADLWSIADACQPSRLGDLKTFCKTYELEGGDARAATRQLRTLVLESDPIRSQPSLMLRRLKSNELSGLPQKHEVPTRVSMKGRQADAYEAAVRYGRSTERQKEHILTVLNKLRSVSLHPNPTEGGMSDDELINSSARFVATFQILDQIASAGERVLIFLESLEVQPMLSKLVQRRYGLPALPLLINGKVSGMDRKRRVDEFEAGHGFNVMILSPRAGGIGLNLVSANHVIHLSRWWNPAVEDQCNDRVYRIGQNRPVTIHIPMAIHPKFPEASFDTKIQNLLERRRALSREVLAPPGADDHDIDELFDQTVMVNEVDQPSKPDSITLSDVDTMDPLEFERFIGEYFKGLGKNVRLTKRSHDGGADLTIFPPLQTDKLAYLIQCKHTQTGQMCPESAVYEVLHACRTYERQLNHKFVPVVVSNAALISSRGRDEARAASVVLLLREDLRNALMGKVGLLDS